MGKSLQDALVSVLSGIEKNNLSLNDRAHRDNSEKLKKSTGKNDTSKSAEENFEILEEDVPSFSQYMQKKGNAPSIFKNTRIVESRSSQKKQYSRTDNIPLLKRNTTKISDKKPVVVVKKIITPSLSQSRTSHIHQQTKPLDTTKSVEASRKQLVEKSQPLASASPPAPAIAQYTVEISSKVAINPLLTTLHYIEQPVIPVHEGIADQVVQNNSFQDERELVIGLDFGTACVKVVVGDTALSKAFAVPFSQHIGVAAYLLPSRVWLDQDKYTLVENGFPIANLKLQLIDPDPITGMDHFSHSAAFLALVIRRARGWLFSEKADVYRHVKILWKLALGLPAATFENVELVERFKRLAAAAWCIAGLPDKEIVKETVTKVCDDAWQTTFDAFCKAKQISDTVFDVVPELSAQIYGFLNSTKFDPNARNHFLMVDVGAGTVDSTVFHVTRRKGKRFQFNFLSNIVDFHGVMNLHEARLRCFKLAIENCCSADSVQLKDVLYKLPISNLLSVPERLEDYFQGVELNLATKELHPDIFFYKKLKKQILDRTVRKAKEFLENIYELGGMPIFLCGGGSRMKFYRKLEEDLLSHPNASWFGFRPQHLEVPKNLSSPGVRSEDFHRLSVAFGLSHLNLGDFLRGEVLPQSHISPTATPKRCPGCKAVGTCYCD